MALVTGTNFNDVHLQVWFDGTRITDRRGTLKTATNLRYETIYPGGRYLSCSFDLPEPGRLTTIPFQVGYQLRVVSRKGTVWEGAITDLVYQKGGMGVRAIGYWGALMMRRNIRKWWADGRLDQNTWKDHVGEVELGRIQRRDAIRLVPRAEAFVTNDWFGVDYQVPTGQTIARIEYDYDFLEGGQVWALRIRDVTNTSTVVTINADGSAAGQSHDFSPVSSHIQFQYLAGANQTPTSDGTYYGEFSNITIYAEWEGSTPTVAEGTVNIYQVCLDLIDYLNGGFGGAQVSANTFRLDSGLTTSIPQFLAEPYDTLADVLDDAARYGDTSAGPVAVGLLASELSSDDKPLLFAESFPVVDTKDGFEYILDWNSENLISGGLSRNTTELANYIWVQYSDENNDRGVLTPADQATLEDDSSKDKPHGQLDGDVRMGDALAGTALDYGERYLAAHKKIQWQVTRPLQIQSYLLSASRKKIPVCDIQAGSRIKIINFVDQALTFLITRTTYDASREVLFIEAGKPLGLLRPDVIRKKK